MLKSDQEINQLFPFNVCQSEKYNHMHELKCVNLIG